MELHQIVNSNKNAGFTLIEFCVATLIMMVGLLGLLQGVNIAIEQNLGNIIRNEAVSVADEQMVSIKTNASTFNGYTTLITLSTPATVSRKNRGSNFSYIVSRDVTKKSTNSKEVVTGVSWTYKNKSHTHKVSSLIIKP
jgi:type IV pilus assembly protein PilV